MNDYDDVGVKQYFIKKHAHHHDDRCYDCESNDLIM